MKKSIQTKRNKPAGGNYRVLYAKTGRKRRLSAATATVEPTADLDSDVSGVGMGRALLVILILHVVAIAAIYFHSKYMGDDGDVAKATEVNAPAVVPDLAKKPAPVAPAPAPVRPAPAAVAPVAALPEPTEDHATGRYIVVTGDTYSRIASVRNVSENALRALNSNRPLRAGVVLDLPAELSTRPVDVAPVREQPAVAVAPTREAPQPRPARAVETPEETYPRAVLVKPTVQPRPAESNIKDSGKRYTVKSGDTVWRIANRYKVSRETLLKINGISDPRKLGAGKTIKIPTE